MKSNAPASSVLPRAHAACLFAWLSSATLILLQPVLWAASIEGRITLPHVKRSTPVVNQRYEIVAKAGVLSTNPPVAVVYLEGSFPKPAVQPVTQILQKDLTFTPSLLPVQMGTKVEFPNLDDTYHNIFSFSAPKRFDLGRYRSDEKPVPSQVFDVAGLVTLRCDIHEHMRALILVLATPHFVITDADGGFRLTGLPEGRFTLKAWVDSKTTREQTVELKGDATLRVDFPVISLAEPQGTRVAGFRMKLLAAMMLVVSGVTLLALYFAQRSLVANVEEDFQREFHAELTAFERVQDVRRLTLMERGRALVRRPRIRAAIEDNALDILYDNAETELGDLVSRTKETAADDSTQGLRAQFYRFLDLRGSVIAPPKPRAVGALRPEEEAQLALPAIPDYPQIGYVARRGPGGETTVSEIVAVPIFSFETGEKLAALVLGFRPFEFGGRASRSGMKSGIWVQSRLHASAIPASAEAVLKANVDRATQEPVRIVLEGSPHLLFSKRLNPDSGYPSAFESSVFPLADLLARQSKLTWQVLGAGTLLLLLGLVGSHVAAARLSAPVEKLAVDSEENRAQRARAEAALEMTSAELQRSARFSADASHQLKTPVTVLRAGLEELLARDNRTPDECAEVSALIHQTYRLSSLIEDLLLLSRMDAGRLKLEFAPVNLSQLIDASLDDLSAIPDEHEVTVETDFPSELHIGGEKRYTAIILQNLLENACKYNRRGGRIRIATVIEGDDVRLRIGNTGGPISADGQAHIFERFHRGVMGENLPGYGLGLNLARELARLHQGDLRLLRSDDTWTEFEVRFRLAGNVVPKAVQV